MGTRLVSSMGPGAAARRVDGTRPCDRWSARPLAAPPAAAPTLYRPARAKARRRRQAGTRPALRVGMKGVITSQSLVTHAGSIIRSFGWRAYLRCVVHVVLRRPPSTFLHLIW